MQLNQFNGGANTRIAPHAIGINEGVIYTNIDNSGISLKPLLEDKDENTDVEKYIFNFKDNWISTDIDRDYQVFQEKLYYSDGVNIPQKSTDGINWYNLGIAKPTTKTDIVDAEEDGNINGTYQYCYTYYNSSDGTESQPAEYSDPLTISDSQIKVSYSASDDAQVDKIRIYRVGGNLPAMSLVTEVDNDTAEYVDNLGDLDIIGSVLDSANHAQAKEGLKYLTEANAMFFAAKDDKLYYSDIAYVNYWSDFNFIDFDANITGIGAIGNGLLVFTKYKTYIITGNSPETLSKYLLSGNQGCLSHKTIGFAHNILVWLSTDGICASNGGEVEVVSRDKLGKISFTDVKQAIIYDDTYYLAYDTDKILCIDNRFGRIAKYIICEVDSFHIYNDTIYYSSNGRLYSMFNGTSNRSLTFKSAEFGDGQLSNIKNYKNVYINAIGSLTIKVYIDRDLVGTYNINSSTREIKLPQDKRRGYTIQFEIKGTGELRELYYIVEGRQNGK